MLHKIEPPCTEPYARWCERSESQDSSYSILCLFTDQFLWDSLHLHSEKVSKVVYDIFGSW